MFLVCCGTVAIKRFRTMPEAAAFAASWSRYGASVRIVREASPETYTAGE